MTNYQRGYKAERELMEVLLGRGYYVMRAGGSRGSADLLAGDGRKVLAIQVKRNASPFSMQERMALTHFADAFRGLAILARRINGGEWIITDMANTRFLL